MQERRTYTYAEVADLIEREFGVRPSLSMLRAEAAEARRRPGTEVLPRLTIGLPGPLEGPGRPAPARFDADAVDAWLATHPRRAWHRMDAALRAGLEEDLSVEAAITAARRGGMSWAQIRNALADVRGDTRTRAGVYYAYRHLDPSRSADGQE